MKKTTLLLVSLFMALFSFAQETETVTWVAADAGYENADEMVTETIAPGYTMSFDNSDATNPAKFYEFNNTCRVYKGGKVIFKGANIVKLVFTCVASKQGEMSASTGELTKEGTTGLTWTGKADEIILSNSTDVNVQLNFTKVELTYEKSEPAVDPMEIMTVMPAEGEVSALSMITLSFDGAACTAREDAEIAIKKDGQEYLSGFVYTNEEGDEVYIEEIDGARITAPGVYTYEIPAGAITVGGQALPAFTLNYTIPAPKVDPLTVLQVTPAEGVVTELENFTITFGDLAVVVNEDALVTLTKEGSNEVVDGGLMCGDGKTVEVGLAERVSAYGKYTLNIPAGAITVDGEALDPLSFKYTIKDPDAKEYTISPEEGKVDELSNFVITFEGYAIVEEGQINVTLNNNITGSEYIGSMFDAGGKIYVVLENPVTENGEYTLTIPANKILVGGQPYGELTFNYTIGEPQEQGDKLLELPAGVEAERWYGEGTFYYYGATGWASMDVDQEFEYNVAFDGNTVYIQGLDRYNPESWVKGTLANGVVTFDYQYSGSDFSDSGEEYKFYIVGTESESPYGVAPFQFSYDAENEVFQNVAGVDCSITPDTESGNVYAYYTDIKLTKSAPAPENPIVLPEGLTPEEYTFTGSELYFDDNDEPIYEEFSKTATIAIDGSDMYIKGISWYFMPEAWAKATINGNVVTIENGQYIGTFSYNGTDYNEYLCGYSDSSLQDVTMTYDEEGGTLTVNNWIIVNGKKSSISYHNIWTDCVFTKNNTGVSEISTDDSSAIYYDAMGRRVSADAKGLLIKQVRMSDGSVKTVKVIR